MEAKTFVTLSVKKIDIVDVESEVLFSASLVDLVFYLWHAKRDLERNGYNRDALRCDNLARRIMDTENYLIDDATKNINL